jgi:UDP-glucose 4-epimerase
MHSVLVTGGAGYIGSHVTVRLVELGYQVTVLDNFSTSDDKVVSKIESVTGGQRNNPVFVKGDARDTRLIDSLFGGNQFSSVIHLAAYKSVTESVLNPIHYLDNNIGALVGILSGMEKFGVTNLVFSSSCTVYGVPRSLPVKEDHPRNPINPYGMSKLVCENILEHLANSKLSLYTICLRYFNPIGSHSSGLIGDDPKHPSPNVLPRLLSVLTGDIDEFCVNGNDFRTRDGSPIRDYIHVMDVAEAHIEAMRLFESSKLHAKRGGFEAVNVGLGYGTSVFELVSLLEIATGRSIRIRVGDRRPGDAEQIYCDVSKAKRLLNKWNPQFSVGDACKHAYNSRLLLNPTR